VFAQQRTTLKERTFIFLCIISYEIKVFCYNGWGTSSGMVTGKKNTRREDTTWESSPQMI
jgi:hypothetical protein